MTIAERRAANRRRVAIERGENSPEHLIPNFTGPELHYLSVLGGGRAGSSRDRGKTEYPAGWKSSRPLAIKREAKL